MTGGFASTGLDGDSLAAVVKQGWGLEVEGISPLGGEVDASARVETTDGRTFCLKGRADGALEDVIASIELEVDVLERLQHADPGIAPRLHQTIDDTNVFRTGARSFWLLEWVDGEMWSEVQRPTAHDQRELGRVARRLQRALQGFEHPAAERTHHWDLRQLDASISMHLDQCADDAERAIADHALTMFSERVTPRIGPLPTSVVHQDLNDFNLVLRDVEGDRRICVIDFGDTLYSATITELAVAVAYAMLRTDHPVDAAANVVAGWYETDTPTADELAVLMPLAIGRLVLNALTWSARRDSQPDYADARSENTWAALHRLAELPLEFIDARLRSACGVELGTAMAPSAQVVPSFSAAPVIDLDPHRIDFDGLDVTNGDALWAAAVPSVPFALTHGRVRADLAAHADGQGGPATVQLGSELYLESGTHVRAPMQGTVVEAGDDRIIVAHGTPESWWSCWTGLDCTVDVGDQLAAGDVLGTTSVDRPVNVQVLSFAPSVDHHLPTRVRPLDAPAWTRISVDPVRFLGFEAAASGNSASVDAGQVAAQRSRYLASSQRYYYDEPMNLVRASGVTFMDSNAHLYLDVINNVTHVGHGNARVVEAASRQMRRLNTNSRFVYEEMGRFAQRLVDRLPDPLEVVYLVCTGSEANDLAIRIARQVTSRSNVMVIEGAYHGNTTVVTGISPNRYRGPGGDGPPSTTHEVMQPNQYRGRFDYADSESGARYADDVRCVAQSLVDASEPPAAFIAESLMGTAGQVVFPDGYLAEAFDHVRSVGGLCISDEVQVGFGRLGDHYWGFERSGVVPDIVTMGKPMGNGHPIAAVVTTREIADAFDQGMKYFNTFGGNPVSCATANAVLDEIDRLDLQAHAGDIGRYFLERLEALKETNACIGDVRGVGLYLGVEFVLDRETKAPATELTTRLCERLRELGVVMYPNGDFGNCLKIKPPMVFSRDDVDHFVAALQTGLRELS